MNRIVAKNLEMMLTKKAGYMPSLISSESMGGNAGAWKGYSCVGVNFSYDHDSGEIMCFENSQMLPPEFLKYPSHCFRVAVDLNRAGRFMIIDYKHPREASETAKSNLEETVKQYNDIRGFKIRPRKKQP